MSPALSGVKVLDLTRVFAGPWATQMLADFGADVVKVEHPLGGDDVRRMGFPQRRADGSETGQTSSFLAMNRNKRSVTLDMAQQEDLAKLLSLAERADILVENFKTGSLRKFGLDYLTLSARNPGLIYCSITGYGQDGPYAPRPGYDPIFQAQSGLLSVTGQPAEAPGAGPALVGYSVSDINAGFYAAISILVALRARDDITGRGQHIDIALLDTQLAAQSHIAQNYLVSGRLPVRAGTASQINMPWQAFPTADATIMIAVGNDRQFGILCKALGAGEIATDPRFVTNRDRMANKSELAPILESAFERRTAAEWVDILNATGIACGRLNDFASALSDPQVVHRKMICEMPDPEIGSFRFVANPMRLSETPASYHRLPPRLGQHNDEVLADWLGSSGI
ncbi:CaiB/BaiF CoA transferase family protein [Bradyrhizobium sp. GCM10027634]|uniref:CaiB/BaiF CoA transferase family protein n=1 Tax=unclassified Bradyrhizobium TaxID=2631580 RepID=UPI001889D9EE|nr:MULTISPECIES: CoA transferase [unclassified Bradyrhizobium]MDN5005616.1 CoA transferase [Bradyrhizobium sp. WYCCWR 12677]QOZ48709.1 CoA transferase [Bradyrhizobium sp. CCBAU 53340]